METQGDQTAIQRITNFWNRWSELVYVIVFGTGILIVLASLIITKFFH